MVKQKYGLEWRLRPARKYLHRHVNGWRRSPLVEYMESEKSGRNSHDQRADDESVLFRDIHPLLLFASHIHVRGGARNRLQAPVSENQVDYAGMVRRLRQQDYSGVLALEYVYTEWQQCNRTDNITETLLLRRALDGSLGRPMKEMRTI